MKNNLLLFIILISNYTFSQEQLYEKKVLDAAEIEFLGSYYKQNGKNAAVNGGIGTEELDNYTGNIVVSVPLNNDDILTADVGFSAYTSASSSNINPFMNTIIEVNNTGGGGNPSTGASRPANYAKEGKPSSSNRYKKAHFGSPWITSTGASRSDVLYSGTVAYSHSSKDRNWIWDVNLSMSKEFDYQSFGIGGGIAKLWNDKNSEISLKSKMYFDKWQIIYPTELHEYQQYGKNFQNMGYFYAIDIFNEVGEKSKSYFPINFTELERPNRNSYALSLAFSQVLTPKSQLAVMFDALYQQGLLSTPYHRVYFADRTNYYIGNIRQIPTYTHEKNTELYQLADDIERLPSERLKFPIAVRYHHYINYFLVLRTFYRFYYDNWGIDAHTFQVELPIKISSKITISPLYRFYTQHQTEYFAPFNQHYSYQKYYTSDYDLSTFYSNQLGGSLSYTDSFARVKFLGFGFKSAEIRYFNYIRSNSLSANILSFGIKFVH